MTVDVLDTGYPIDFRRDAAIKAIRMDRHLLLHPTPAQINNNWSLLGKSHSNLPVFPRKPMKDYRQPQNLIRADCELRHTPTMVQTHSTKDFLHAKWICIHSEAFSN